MTNLIENPVYESGIFQIETTTPVEGGVVGFNLGVPTTGFSNAQAQQLANRTAYLNNNKVSTSDLGNSSDIAKGDALVAVSQPFTGAGAITQHDKNAQVCHIDDFPSTPANTWLDRAIDGTPDGYSLQLGYGPYIGKVTKTRSNIRICGLSMPYPNAGKTALVNGTVIQGTLKLTGSNIMIERIGFDSGSDVCTALNSGNPMDCFVINDPARNPMYNCTVKDCVGLAQSSAAAAHNFLLEGLVDSYFENLHSFKGQWGTVLKTEKSTANGIYSYGCSQAGLTLKSDTGVSGTICRKTSVSNVKIFDDGYSAAVSGVLIYAATDDLSNVSLSDFHIEGCVSGLKMVCDTRAVNVNVLSSAAISNGTIINNITYGIETFGAIRGVKISNVVVSDVVTGTSINVQSDCLGMDLVNVTASSPTGTNLINNIRLAGRYTFTNLISCVSHDYSVPSGIDCFPDGQSTARVGSYIGNLAFSDVVVGLTLTNGWTSFFSTVTARVQAGRVQLFGRVAVPPTPWTGKTQIGTINSAISPGTPKYAIAPGYDTAGKISPVLLRIQGGAIFADDLLTPAAFPATITFIALDQISWPLSE